MFKTNAKHVATTFAQTILLARWFFIERVVRRRLFACLGTSNSPICQRLAGWTVGDLLVSAPLVTLTWYGLQSTLGARSPRESGIAAWYSLVVTIVYANKSSSLLATLLGLSWERLVPYHAAAALVAVGNSVLHMLACFYFSAPAVEEAAAVEDAAAVAFLDDTNLQHDEMYRRGRRPNKSNMDVPMIQEDPSPPPPPPVLQQHFSQGTDPNFLRYLWDGSVCSSGTVMAICLALLISWSAHRWLRKHNFDLWLASHILLSVGIACASLVHAANFSKLAFLWWGLDVFLRHVFQPFCTSPKVAAVTEIGKGLVEIRFPRPERFHFKAGQFVRIAVKELGILQYHPVTISSAPYETDEATVHFRVRGDWTQKLSELATGPHGKASISPATTITTSIAIQGPFGSPMMNLDNHRRYPHVLLVCGGIGVTPMISVVRQLLYNHHCLGQKRYRIHLVWAVPDAEIVNHLPILTDRHDVRLLTRPVDVSTTSEGSQPDIEAVLSDTSLPRESTEKTVDIETPPTHSGSRGHPSSVFRGDIYLTKSAQTPVWTDDRFRFHCQQRPDPDRIIRETSKKIAAMHQRAHVSCISHVAVLACGPPALVKATKVACHKYNSSCCEGSAFHFHEETFDY